MANGWAPDGAVQEQIEDSVKDALASVRARMPTGDGLAECEECGEPIPDALIVASTIGGDAIPLVSFDREQRRYGIEVREP